MNSLATIWNSSLDDVNIFLLRNEISPPDNDNKVYILASQLSAKLGLLSFFETELVEIDTFEYELSQRPDLSPGENLVFGLLSLANRQDSKCPYSDIDKNGNTIDGISFETIDPQDSVSVNGRCYNISTIISLLEISGLDAKDPFNPNLLIIDALRGQNDPRINAEIERIRQLPDPRDAGLSQWQLDFRRRIETNLPILVYIEDLNFGGVYIKLDSSTNDFNFDFFSNTLEALLRFLSRSRIPLTLGIDIPFTEDQINRIPFNNIIVSLGFLNINLTSIPINIPYDIKHLFLERNNLGNISLNFSNFTMLSKLYLNNNNLTTMSNLILPNDLKLLDLSQNHISIIDYTVLPNGLKSLILKDNNIGILNTNDERSNLIITV